MPKEQKYKEVLRNIDSLVEGENDVISVMSTIACELYHSFEHFNWVGFYRLVDDTTLKVGPYQGSHGCLTIHIEKGVCGKCAREKRIQLENDVANLPHHIACSSDTQSEIVLPVIDRQGHLRAVLDIDSFEKDSFDEIDKVNLLRLVELVGNVL